MNLLSQASKTSGDRSCCAIMQRVGGGSLDEDSLGEVNDRRGELGREEEGKEGRREQASDKVETRGEIRASL